ncbi:MAG: hypothetical protein R6X13_08280, partial [bacterium]
MRRCLSRAVARICRQWTGGKTGVPVAAALLAALLLLPALLPALAFASAPRAARYEAYPWTGWQKLDEAEQKRLTRIAYGGKDYDSMVQAWNTKSKAGVWDEPFPRFSYRWADAAPHPELARLLPGVRFLGQRVNINSSTAGPWGTAIALLNGRLYELRSLNNLLVDCGFKFDTTEIPAIAKIAVLWKLMDQHAGNAFGLAPDSAALATAIPAVTFRKIGLGRWQHPTRADVTWRALKIDLTVGGELTTAWLALQIGTLKLEFLEFDGQSYRFRWGAVSPNKKESGFPLTDERRAMTVTPAEYVRTETDDSGRVHH